MPEQNNHFAGRKRGDGPHADSPIPTQRPHGRFNRVPQADPKSSARSAGCRADRGVRPFSLSSSARTAASLPGRPVGHCLQICRMTVSRSPDWRENSRRPRPRSTSQRSACRPASRMPSRGRSARNTTAEAGGNLYDGKLYHEGRRLPAEERLLEQPRAGNRDEGPQRRHRKQHHPCSETCAAQIGHRGHKGPD